MGVPYWVWKVPAYLGRTDSRSTAFRMFYSAGFCCYCAELPVWVVRVNTCLAPVQRCRLASTAQKHTTNRSFSCRASVMPAFCAPPLLLCIEECLSGAPECFPWYFIISFLPCSDSIVGLFSHCPASLIARIQFPLLPALLIICSGKHARVGLAGGNTAGYQMGLPIGAWSACRSKQFLFGSPDLHHSLITIK